MNEPLTNTDARRLLSEALAEDALIVWSSHALRELTKDNLTKNDAMNVLQNGRMLNNEPAEFEHSSWRYRFHTHRICVVVAFDEDDGDKVVAVVTAWRK